MSKIHDSAAWFMGQADNHLRYSSPRVCVGGCTCTPQILQILQRRQVLDLQIHLKTLRTFRSRKKQEPANNNEIVERRRRGAAAMARTEHGHPAWVRMYTSQRRMPGDIHAGFGGTGRTI